jgi:hypothetical protein
MNERFNRTGFSCGAKELRDTANARIKELKSQIDPGRAATAANLFNGDVRAAGQGLWHHPNHSGRVAIGSAIRHYWLDRRPKVKE